ncbi:hypothetical protein [Lysobacter enzymogenes]|uniref:hypothetical protein n=1 Tax=Lysobacter enzymogenes TaxID=69 RepID=UPI001A963010|nr:hypothetical protein [Lysobacter enzymogenes]QQP94966.1 hypothetical protein JHW38_17175 [Lysobacter enzymogenes]
MSLDFQPRLGSAVDADTGLTIYEPRLQPASPPASPDDTEYQYAIFLDGKRFYGLGLNGSDAVVDKAGRRERVFLLELGSAGALDAALDLKRRLANDEPDFVFLRELARGLVGVFETRTDNDDDTRYLAVVDAAALAERGIAAPESVARLADGELVLAEAFVPAHADGSDAS